MSVDEYIEVGYSVRMIKEGSRSRLPFSRLGSLGALAASSILIRITSILPTIT